jgi:hypothetical protein
MSKSDVMCSLLWVALMDLSYDNRKENKRREPHPLDDDFVAALADLFNPVREGSLGRGLGVT